MDGAAHQAFNTEEANCSLTLERSHSEKTIALQVQRYGSNQTTKTTSSSIPQFNLKLEYFLHVNSTDLEKHCSISTHHSLHANGSRLKATISGRNQPLKLDRSCGINTPTSLPSGHITLRLTSQGSPTGRSASCQKREPIH